MSQFCIHMVAQRSSHNLCMPVPLRQQRRAIWFTHVFWVCHAKWICSEEMQKEMESRKSNTIKKQTKRHTRNTLKPLTERQCNAGTSQREFFQGQLSRGPLRRRKKRKQNLYAQDRLYGRLHVIQQSWLVVFLFYNIFPSSLVLCLQFFLIQRYDTGIYRVGWSWKFQECPRDLCWLGPLALPPILGWQGSVSNTAQ